MSALAAALHRWSACESVGIRLRVGDDFPYCATSGMSTAFVHDDDRLCAYDRDGNLLRDDGGRPVLECTCGDVLRGRFDPTRPFFTPHGSFWSNSTTALLASAIDADRHLLARGRCHGEGYESLALIPLRAGDQVVGLLQFNDRRAGRFTPALVAQFERLADSLATALAGRQAEAALRASEARYHGLFSQMTEGFGLCETVCDDAGNLRDLCLIDANPAFERHTGLKGRDLLGRTFQELFPDAEPLWIEQLGQVAVTGDPVQFQAVFGPLRRHFDVRAFAAVPGCIGVLFTDITERRQID
jgi:PAS domain-containing protein